MLENLLASSPHKNIFHITISIEYRNNKKADKVYEYTNVDRNYIIPQTNEKIDACQVNAS